MTSIAVATVAGVVAVATVAAAMTAEQTVAAATTVAPAAKATVATVATAMARGVASATVASVAAVTAMTTMASMAAVSGYRLLLTAHQGETDHREKNRDAQYQRTIHAKVLQCKHDSRGKQKYNERYRHSGCERSDRDGDRPGAL